MKIFKSMLVFPFKITGWIVKGIFKFFKWIFKDVIVGIIIEIIKTFLGL